MTRRLTPLLLGALAACTPTGDDAAAPPTPSDTAVPGVECDATPIQDLIGRNADEVTADAQRRSGARSVRRYVTGSAVTMDFRSDRLNIETDAGGTIVKLGCG